MPRATFESEQWWETASCQLHITHTSMLTPTIRDPPWPSGYDASWLPSVSSQVRVSAGSPSGLAWSLYKCAALWKAVLWSFRNWKTPWNIREDKGISSRFRVSISSRYDLSCWKRRKNQFLPFFLFCLVLVNLCALRLKSFITLVTSRSYAIFYVSVVIVL